MDKRVLSTIRLSSIYLAVFCVGGVVVVRVWHFVVPEDWQWLSAERLWGLDCLIVISLVGLVMGLWFRMIWYLAKDSCRS